MGYSHHTGLWCGCMQLLYCMRNMPHADLPLWILAKKSPQIYLEVCQLDPFLCITAFFVTQQMSKADLCESETIWYLWVNTWRCSTEGIPALATVLHAHWKYVVCCVFMHVRENKVFIVQWCSASKGCYKSSLPLLVVDTWEWNPVPLRSVLSPELSAWSINQSGIYYAPVLNHTKCLKCFTARNSTKRLKEVCTAW